jgi:hypothetical protein
VGLEPDESRLTVAWGRPRSLRGLQSCSPRPQRVSANIDDTLADAQYGRVRLIALIDTIAFIGATMLLMMIVIPFSDAAEVEARVYIVVH